MTGARSRQLTFLQRGLGQIAFVDATTGCTREEAEAEIVHPERIEQRGPLAAALFALTARANFAGNERALRKGFWIP